MHPPISNRPNQGPPRGTEPTDSQAGGQGAEGAPSSVSEPQQIHELHVVGSLATAGMYALLTGRLPLKEARAAHDLGNLKVRAFIAAHEYGGVKVTPLPSPTRLERLLDDAIESTPKN